MVKKKYPILKSLIFFLFFINLSLHGENISSNKDGLIFVYNAKTPNITYDQNPFIAVTDVFQWGFRGFSAHWREPRQYTWNEVGTDVYEIFRSEVNDVLRLSLMNKRLNT